ncbi:6-pyruvoyltetrahydropterin/6-carboxytetrahydropterin synthase [Desulfitispora alkaliphila]|uniref:6-carboxytetrahydropterin synthase QueD n=1 Tax=Desulfitispora alkaliphila TaxID=622674 RepID=UPI003D261B9D
MYFLKVISHFDSAHYLRQYSGKCSNIHGHTWKIEVTVKGSKLNHQGLLIDFGDLKTLLAKVTDQFDHKLINNVDGFTDDELNPTAENLAYYIYNKFQVALPEHVAVHQVEVWESEKSCAIYSEER